MPRRQGLTDLIAVALVLAIIALGLVRAAMPSASPPPADKRPAHPAIAEWYGIVIGGPVPEMAKWRNAYRPPGLAAPWDQAYVGHNDDDDQPVTDIQLSLGGCEKRAYSRDYGFVRCEAERSPRSEARAIADGLQVLRAVTARLGRPSWSLVPPGWFEDFDAQASFGWDYAPPSATPAASSAISCAGRTPAPEPVWRVDPTSTVSHVYLTVERSGVVLGVKGHNPTHPAIAPVPLCGFSDDDVGDDVTLRMPMYRDERGFMLNFAIDPHAAQLPVGVTMSKPAQFTFDWASYRGLNRRTLGISLALRQRNGTPLILRSVKLDCGAGIAMESGDLTRFRQLEDYQSGETFFVPFDNQDSLLQPCQDALIRGNRLVLDIATTSDIVPQFRLLADLPVGAKAAQALCLWRRDRARAAAGQCTRRPEPQPIIG